MSSPVWETIAEIARAERKNALKGGDYPRALVAALLEGWARETSDRA